MVKKSAATISSQCRLRNSFQGGLATALRRRFHAVPAQDVGNRGAADGMPEVGKRTLDPLTAPVAILPSHPDHQRFDFLWCSFPARQPSATAVVFLRDQLPMPSQQRFRRNDGSHLSE
jgi:hypothetical protein